VLAPEPSAIIRMTFLGGGVLACVNRKNAPMPSAGRPSAKGHFHIAMREGMPVEDGAWFMAQ